MWVNVGRWIGRNLRRGTRVRMTQRALDQGLRGYAKTIYGTVQRDSGSYFLWVRKDGQKTTSQYWSGFWEVRR